MSHKVCFYGEIWLIIPKLSLLEHCKFKLFHLLGNYSNGFRCPNFFILSIYLSQVERWCVSILPQGSSGDEITTTSIDLKMLICGSLIPTGPPHTVNILNKILRERNKYNVFVLRVGHESAPYHGHCKTDRPLGLYGPKTGKCTIY